MMRNRYEILAPAGNMAALEAAVIAGADAVYLGSSEFSARAKAKNFNIEELKRAVKFAHLRNIKIFVTMNILISDDEMDDALKLVGKLYDIGVDALIVQDFGLAKEIRENFSDFEIHASTQMAVNNYYGALFLKEFGFSRVVLARETPIFEVLKIKELGIEIETFIHGALCVSYSGECLMSSMIGAKSGNRGECAQACRKAYEIYDLDKNLLADKKYYLSPKDLNTLDSVKDMIDAGAYSLKIEGRMKNPEYVYTVVSAYKKAIEGGLTGDDKKDVTVAFNRGFTKGLFNGDFGRDFISYDRPDNRGIEIGRVISNSGGFTTVKFFEDVYPGDGIEFKRDGRTFGIRSDKFFEKNKNHSIKLPKIPDNESTINRTFSVEWKEDVDRKLNEYEYKVPIDIKVKIKIGKKPEIFGEAENLEANFVLDETIDVAKNSPITTDKIEENISKLGDTIFKIRNLEIDLEDKSFMRISSINALRRGLVEKLEKEILDRNLNRRDILSVKFNNKTEHKETKSKIKVFFNKFEDLKNSKLKNIDEIIIRLKDLESFQKLYPNKNVSIYLDKFYSYEELEKIREEILKSKNIDGIWINNIGEYYIFKDDNLKINADIGLNIFNRDAVKFFEDLGLSSITLSPELNAAQIREISKEKTEFNLISYGRVPVMTMDHCPYSVIKGCVNIKNCPSCMFKNYYLRDGKDVDFEVLRQNTFTEIFNSYPILFDRYLEEVKGKNINFLILADEFTDEVVDLYKDFSNDKYESLKNKLTKKYGQVTKGHINRGIISD
jgi:putative protease